MAQQNSTNLTSGTLMKVDPELIHFDQKNPRGEKPEQIEKDETFKDLKKSVKRFGVLIPLTARTRRSARKPYMLVDGERRLRAALSENKDSVPVHLIEGDEVDGRVLAYNIHMLRKQWDKRVEVSSIREIRDELIRKNKDITESELFNKLREITNHKEHDLRTLLAMLKYGDAAIGKVQDGTLAMSYLVQIDSSFLSPFNRMFPKLYSRYGDATLRKILVRKAEDGKLGNTRYLMDYVLDFFKKPGDRSKEYKTNLRNVTKKFLDDREQHVRIIVQKMTVQQKAAKKRKAKKKKKKATTKKALKITREETFEYASLKITKKHLSRINDIRPRLEKVAASFTDEESEYIKEGICCLEKHCFKATVLMVWATGISRILKYVERNLADFNKASKAMADQPKSFYKYFAKNFQKNAGDIEDVRENSNDRQLLCYICYKGFITKPEFKKLKSNYDTRNDCAHPTAISLTSNEIIVIFENVHNLLLANRNLK